MSIALKDQGELLVIASIPGAAAVDAHVFNFVIPFACRLKSVEGKATVAGTTDTGTYDINKNNTTIFSSAKVDFATTSQTPTIGALSTDPTDFAAGDVLSIDCDAVHSTPIDGVSFLLVFQRFGGTVLTAKMISGSTS